MLIGRRLVADRSYHDAIWRESTILTGIGQVGQNRSKLTCNRKKWEEDGSRIERDATI